MAQTTYQKLWYAENKDKHLSKCNTYRKSNKETINLEVKARAAATKLDVMTTLGGKCVCCGEAELKFLNVDHINGVSEQEKASGYRSGLKLYRRVQREGYPKALYQVLCFNCNMAKGLFGVCPHIEAKAAAKTDSLST
jgi:hypothetical protein